MGNWIGREVDEYVSPRELYKLIYIIDDDPSVRRGLGRLLKAAGFSVRAYASGKEFLDHEKAIEKDCIILDVQMPGMNGLELQQLLRDDDLHVPVIFITGHHDDKARIAARRAGAVGFFHKPFDDQALIDTIEFALKKSD